jgi:hypothetical protein
MMMSIATSTLGRVDDGSHFWTADFEPFDEATGHCNKLLNDCERILG